VDNELERTWKKADLRLLLSRHLPEGAEKPCAKNSGCSMSRPKFEPGISRVQRMLGPVPPLPHTPSRCGAYLHLLLGHGQSRSENRQNHFIPLALRRNTPTD
jgi:hypothetical protein